MNRIIPPAVALVALPLALGTAPDSASTPVPGPLVAHVDEATWGGMTGPHRDMLLRLATDPAAEPLGLCWTEGSDPSIVGAFESVVEARDPFGFTFADNSRWSDTATDNPPQFQGDPITLTWGIVADGTFIPSGVGEPADTSDLIAFLDGIYGAGPGGSDLTQRPWFTYFEQVFDEWASQIGVRYVYEPADDGSSVGGAEGSLGVRPDLRISGKLIDGNSGVLAYNYFPDDGDMVIDTADNFFSITTQNSRRLRNVLAHEHGHGLGIRHVCPVSATKLMEPNVTTAFDMVQFDDQLAGARGYGDTDEWPDGNESVADATDLGAIALGGALFYLNPTTIDDNGDVDVYSFTAPANAMVTTSIAPTGFIYLSGPQNGDGTCSAGTSFDPRNESDLALEVLDAGGGVIVAMDNQPAGGTESITDEPLPDGAGVYHVRITGTANRVQGYFLQVRLDEMNLPPVAACAPFDTLVAGGPGCTAVVDPEALDAGSSDPNGDTLLLSLEPSGPYAEGVTPVDLIVSDGELADTCSTTITVACGGSSVEVEPNDVTLAPVSPPDEVCVEIVVRNTGAFPRDTVDVAGCGADGYSLDTGALSVPVAPGDSTSFLVCFSPVPGYGDSCLATVDLGDTLVTVTVRAGSVTSTGGAGGAGLAVRLAPPTPTPFRSGAVLRYALGSPEDVSLAVFDLRGRRVRILEEGIRPAGDHEVAWDGRDASGREVPAGVYVIRLRAGNESRTVRAVRLR